MRTPEQTAKAYAERLMKFAEKPENYAKGWDSMVECLTIPEIAEQILEDVQSGMTYKQIKDEQQNVAEVFNERCNENCW